MHGSLQARGYVWDCNLGYGYTAKTWSCANRSLHGLRREKSAEKTNCKNWKILRTSKHNRSDVNSWSVHSSKMSRWKKRRLSQQGRKLGLVLSQCKYGHGRTGKRKHSAGRNKPWGTNWNNYGQNQRSRLTSQRFLRVQIWCWKHFKGSGVACIIHRLCNERTIW